jgi:hypothetical protein
MNNKPKRLFLMDGLGALTTAGLLFFLLAEFEYIFGMPKEVLHALSFMAILFSAYSFSCLLMVKQKWKFFLSLIAIANIIYCLLTSGLILYHYPQLTGWGLMYFIGEIAIIITLAYAEIKAVISET